MQFKFISLNLFTACFYWKFRKTWCLLTKSIAMNPKNHCVNKFCFNISFLFLLYLKLPGWNLHFLACFCYWPNFFRKGDEGNIFSKAPGWRTLFLLKIKIKQNPGCQNKEWKCSLQKISSEYECLSGPVIGKILHIGKNMSKRGVG